MTAVMIDSLLMIADVLFVPVEDEGRSGQRQTGCTAVLVPMDRFRCLHIHDSRYNLIVSYYYYYYSFYQIRSDIFVGV